MSSNSFSMILSWTMCCLGISLTVIEAGEPVQAVTFRRAGIVSAWKTHGDRITFGKGQTLALVDDGCKLSMPEWSMSDGDQPKVLVTYDAVDGDSDPAHVGRGYHGSTIGIPSSVNDGGKSGVAYNNQVAVLRALECCHCSTTDGKTVAVALQWIIDHKRYHITTVNLAPVNDREHSAPVATDIDGKLLQLRQLGGGSAPADNHNYTDGISWPACQPGCFAIGAVRSVKDKVYLDRHSKVDLVVPAAATSSSNAIACGAAIAIREAMDVADYDWKKEGADRATAILNIMPSTRVKVFDPGSGLSFQRLDLNAALQHIFKNDAR